MAFLADPIGLRLFAAEGRKRKREEFLLVCNSCEIWISDGAI